MRTRSSLDSTASSNSFFGIPRDLNADRARDWIRHLFANRTTGNWFIYLAALLMVWPIGRSVRSLRKTARNGTRTVWQLLRPNNSSVVCTRRNRIADNNSARLIPPGGDATFLSLSLFFFFPLFFPSIFFPSIPAESQSVRLRMHSDADVSP